MDRTAPLNYLHTNGLRADAATPLFWATTAISVAVVVIVLGLLLAGLLRRRPGNTVTRLRPESEGTAWIAVGVTLSTVVLLGVTVWTVMSIAAAIRPPGAPTPLNVTVIAHQWWWEVRYRDQQPQHDFTTANEIHIPVGQAVEVTLRSDDVIHSFWVPALAGKTDVIPGQPNSMWLEAQSPGVYRGQCAEFCGLQHAHMALEVVASTPDEFAAWRDIQLQTAIAGRSADDEAVFMQHCGVCHTVRGTRAGGILGPDLSHLMTRRTLAAGTLPNTAGYLAGWIADPQAIKPGTLMPQIPLSGTDLSRVVRFLQTLE